MVHRTFAEFEHLHHELQEKYGHQPPQLPKMKKSTRSFLSRNTLEEHASSPKGKSSKDEEALESFKEDLETYLRVVAANSTLWLPTVYNIKVPHPDDRSRGRVRVNSTLFEFFAMEEPISTAQQVDQTEVLCVIPVSLEHLATEKAVEDTENVADLVAPHQHQATLLNSIPTESSRHVGYEDLTLATAARDISAQIRVAVEDFTIYLGDHIDYHIRVHVCGHQWIMSKRYSELEELHEALRKFYGKDQVPSFSASRVAAWRKRDKKTGILRQRFFANYLNEVIVGISAWEPQGLFCSVELMRSAADGLRSKVEVTVNNFLFDFFCFKDHVAQLSGDDALHAIEEQQALLPEETAHAFAFQRRSDRRDRLRHAIELQAKALHPTSNDEMERLLEAFRRLRDDKDIIRLFEHFLITGEVAEDIQMLDSVAGPRLVTVNSPMTDMPSRHTSPQVTPRLETSSSAWSGTPVKGTQRRFVLDKDVCDTAIFKGLTSGQVLQLVEPIGFNDTKIAVLRLFTPALVEMSDLQLVFDTLWFDWDQTRLEVEDLLLAERAGGTSGEFA